MKNPDLDQKIKLTIICLVIGTIFVFSWKKTERIGDQLQIALPALGFACSIANGQALEYSLRFGVMEAGLHGARNGLWDAQINTRPSGGYWGFPSGHTTAAFFGASSLVTDCITGNVYVKGLVMFAAAYVGGSRLEADQHTTIQVVAGVFWGWISQLGFRNRGGLTGRLRRLLNSFRKKRRD